MSQLSLYVTQNDLKKIKSEAKRLNMSMSKWAAQKLLADFKPSFPQGYEKLCGCITDESFARPEQPSRKFDAARESFR